MTSDRNAAVVQIFSSALVSQSKLQWMGCSGGQYISLEAECAECVNCLFNHTTLCNVSLVQQELLMRQEDWKAALTSGGQWSLMGLEKLLTIIFSPSGWNFVKFWQEMKFKNKLIYWLTFREMTTFQRAVLHHSLSEWTLTSRVLLTMLFHRPLANSSWPLMVKWKQSWVKKVMSIFPFCSGTQNIRGLIWVRSQREVTFVFCRVALWQPRFK